MPKKYHIKVRLTRPRFSPIGKFSIIEQDKFCLHCPVDKCIKKDCVYDVYKKRTFDTYSMLDTIDSLCKNCFRCIQECKNNAITKTINPNFRLLGNSYYTPDLIASTWFQAETGKIPVSGAGYRGPFTGSGFDSMWTDMSEIVRPTRDGIHGREYISTSIDLGRKPSHLQFDQGGDIRTRYPEIVELPIPVIFDILPFGYVSKNIYLAMAKAARILNTFMIIDIEEYDSLLEPYVDHLIPLISIERLSESGDLVKKARIVELPFTDRIIEDIQKVKEVSKKTIVSIRVSLTEDTEEVVSKLVSDGAEIIHPCADETGHDIKGVKPRSIKDAIRQIHLRLVSERCRDEVTIIASGGIADASHVAKAIICGADGVGIDIPLLVALECRVCGNCKNDIPCPVRIDEIRPEWGERRLVNLLGAWHSQLIEVLGAMGMREIRRLRGEVGRAMFYEDLERETFGEIFGKRDESRRNK
ncbi:MAG: glutamate synthase-related protein [bacterium]|nr:glutamate synthase-related protein [bacterium]